MIDTMAERYGMLPTDIIQRATTFDLFVFDSVVDYKNKLERRATGQEPVKGAVPRNEQQLIEMFKKVKNDASKDNK